jgi:membrane dipeptidase
MNEPFILDAHLDLALNAMEWNRDLTRPLADLRADERGLNDKRGRARGTVCFEEMRRGRVGLAVVTQLARVNKNDGLNPVAVWQSPAQAWSMTQAQLAWYREMEALGEIRMIHSRDDLDAHVNQLQSGRCETIGCILGLEGADSLVNPAYVERAYNYGLRAIGPAHYGPGRYAQGTKSTGGLPAAGRELLREMDRFGIILDATHLTDECFWEALEIFQGPVWASHHNCRALVNDQRQLPDDQIKALIERDAVIGAAMDGWMIVPGWIQGKTTSDDRDVRLEHLAAHIDHICQIAGNARHVGFGTDLDGGYGTEQTPRDLNSIGDVGKLLEILRGRGWSQEDISTFAHGNFLRVLRKAFK